MDIKEQAKIIFNEQVQKYQLLLSDDVLLHTLLILDPQKAPVIAHKDKLKLEWLQNDLLGFFEERKKEDKNKRGETI